MDVAAAYRIPHSAFLAWDEDDREKALAHLLRERSRCRGCGTREEEWEGRKRPYVGRTHICQGCAELQRTQASVESSPALRDARGLHVELVRAEVPRAES